ncbi:MAG: hypothetical protein LUQ59_04520 [Methanothrix sp.]|nr:hypothetical protein [Methanothrix sp.]
MRQVALPRLLFVDVVIDIDRLPHNITLELLDEFPGHAGAAKMGGEPVAAAMRAKARFQGRADI